MQAIYDLAAPAKLNLFLHIVGRRDDGYHLLQSAFVLIDWCDRLHFELRPDGLISREDLGSPLPADDLVVRAAQALKHATACPFGAHIGVLKRIPTQAGLGGGSSDAATCLLALNRLWRLHLDRQALAAIGLRLGADVPFFIGGRNAWVQGIGEQLQAINIPASWYLVAKPPQGLPTAAIFAHPTLKRDTETATIAGFAEGGAGFGRNDLQQVAQQLCTGVTTGLAWLDRLGLSGRMTGSGSAVFARSPVAFDMGEPPAGFEARWCRGLDAHPLADWAGSDGFAVNSTG